MPVNRLLYKNPLIKIEYILLHYNAAIQLENVLECDVYLYEAPPITHSLTLTPPHTHPPTLSTVPGNPITQNIVDSGSGVTVYGDGLSKAEVGRQAKFFIDAKGQRGEITHYQVDGE